MLDKLPPEIILTVTTFLDFKERLNTALTCRKLKDLICEEALYQHLKLNIITNHATDHDKISMIINKFESKEFNANQVKRLDFSFSLISDENLRRLPSVFHSIIELNDTDFVPYFSEPKSDDILNKMVVWRDRLERLYMNGRYSLLSELVERNVFSNLTDLSISPSKDNVLRGEVSPELLQCLKNVPSLKKLRMYNGVITVENLEEIHHICFQLKSISIKDSIIDASTYVLPKNIRPTTRFFTLELERDIKICDNKRGFLDYIIAKYPRLVKLYFSNAFNWVNVHQPEFGIDVGLPYRIVNNMDGNKRNFFEKVKENLVITKKVYFESGSQSFLSRLPPTLKTLIINPTLFGNITEELENSNLQPENFILHRYYWKKVVFVNPQLFEIFKKWTSLTLLTLTISGELANYLGSLISDSLTMLELHFPVDYSVDIGIDAVLASFPSLKSLDIGLMYSFALSEKSTGSDQAMYPSLRHLTFSSCVCMPEAMDFLRRTAPNIETIKWAAFINRKPYKSEMHCYKEPIYAIDLKGFNLDRLTLEITVERTLCDCNSKRGVESYNYSWKEMGYELHIELQSQEQIDMYCFNPHRGLKIYQNYPSTGNLDDNTSKSIKLTVTHDNNLKQMTIEDPIFSSSKNFILNKNI